ncbi:MAG: HAMP domain-containing histidine kinase [Lachnospiraceae bacterium]|nr:HAMP domain-containing histidine kinase [Lachnospiraceae bacterium]
MEMENFQSAANYEFIDEDYLPIESQGIWENFIKGNCSMEQMCNAYGALEYVLDHIGGEINQYKKCLNQYNLAEKGTNVSYWISKEQEDIIYTNIKEPLDIPLAEYGKKKGKYVFYQENDIRLETNVKGMEEVFYDSLEPQYGGKGSVIFVCVDTKFPCEDIYSNAKAEYNRMRPWIYLSVIGVTVSVAVCLICLIYLSMAAGRREGENVICLNLFDRIPTEILYILMIATGVICFLLFGALLFRFGGEELSGLLIMSGVLTFFTTALLSTFYLSFVRRIRAGILWNQSILHWFVRGIGMVFENRKSSTKVLLWFGLHLLLCGVLLYYMLNNAYKEDVMILGTLAFLLLCGVEGVLIVREGVQRNKVLEGIRKISGGDLEYKIAVEELKGDNRRLAEEVNNIGDGLFHAVDDNMRNEHLKTDLITNVSHDIKTPLTSIINYVDLLKREDLQNERVQSYIAVLDSKSQRLKQLTEDLVEASKVSSGNIKLEMERINLVELIHQTEGEFDEKFQAKGLAVITNLPKEPVVVLADGRRIWRVLENLYNNVAKYAMKNTRVYVDMEADGEQVWFSIKNISENPLNIQADELTERFIRGDISRNTEGSGLGLSIAKNLTDLMGGTFEIYLDGDLFKATLGFRQEPASRNLPEREKPKTEEIETEEG